MVSGEGGQKVDVHMGVDEAALHPHHTVVSLLCILLVIPQVALLASVANLANRWCLLHQLEIGSPSSTMVPLVLV